MSFAMTSPMSTLVLVAATAIAVSGCGVNVAFGDDATDRTETRTIDARELGALRVDTANGAISISGTDGDTIEITARLRERSAGDAEFTVTERDGELTVSGDCDGGWFDDCRVGFEIQVPRDVEIDVDSDNGRIELRALDGDVDAETDNGAIDAERLTAGRVSATSDNGRITLDFDDAPDTVTAITDNGAIEIRVGGDEAYDVDVDSDHGTIDVDLPTDPDAARRMVAHSDNGSIRVADRRG